MAVSVADVPWHKAVALAFIVTGSAKVTVATTGTRLLEHPNPVKGNVASGLVVPIERISIAKSEVKL